MTAEHLYVHVPFCARRCSYCDFAIAVRRVVPVSEYLASIRAEIRARNPERSSLRSVYLGGGTPSHLGQDGIASLIDLIGSSFEVTSDTEITLEANPDDVDPASAKRWRQAGVNRVSLGIQSFDDNALRWMHRVHDAERAMSAYEDLRAAGFGNISVDLIFALPEVLGRSWEKDLARAIALSPDHISLYGLTIEHATPLSRWQDRGTFVPADEDRYAEEFLLAHRLTAAAGFEHYEVSNFAKSGRKSVHNAAYWSGVPFIGLGPSAHSFDGMNRSWSVRDFADWTAKLARGESIVAGSEELSEANRLAEKVYLGLRTRGGLKVTGRDRLPAEEWERAGWAEIEGDTVRLTTEGWLRLDSLATALTGL